MPFIIVKTDQCPTSKPYGVFTETAHGSNKTQGSPHGCFSSTAAAREQQKALYASVPEAKAAGEPPPNLRDATEGSDESCKTCEMFWGYSGEASIGFCSGYTNAQVRPDQVCDSYSPMPTDSEEKSETGHPEVPMTTTTASPVLTPKTIEWRRGRARALSENQRKRTETRQAHAPLELRAGEADGVRVLRSYASLFDEPYVVRASGHRFEEIIRSGAFKRTLGTNPDVVFRTEHSGPPLAATWSGNLRLGTDDRGLWYEVDMDESDPDIVSLIAKVERGVYRESSFAFRVPNGGDRWNEAQDQREILSCELDRGDVSVVTFGASRATGQYMLLRSEEEAVAAIQDLGFERFVEVFKEWRNFTLLSREERIGKVISSQSMESLRQVLGLIANADDAVDEAEAMLSDFLGIPNPDEEDGDVTGAEQLTHVGRGEKRDDPTYEDYDVMYGLKQVKLALASVKACQLSDPDYESDPDDATVMAQIEAADAEIDKAIVAQSKDGRRDPEENAQIVELLTRHQEDDAWVELRFAMEPILALRSGEDAYWLRSQDDVPVEERADLSTAGRQKMATAGTAMKDGSYPIPNVTFLKKAIRAFGRAKNKPAVKAWIKKRAAALGASNLVPESWRGTTSAVRLASNDTEDLRDALRLRSAS